MNRPEVVDNELNSGQNHLKIGEKETKLLLLNDQKNLKI